MNYQMEIFHEQMIDLINKSGLPIGAAYFIVKDCLHELEMGYRKAIFNERNSKPETVEQTLNLTEDPEDKEKSGE